MDINTYTCPCTLLECRKLHFPWFIILGKTQNILQKKTEKQVFFYNNKVLLLRLDLWGYNTSVTCTLLNITEIMFTMQLFAKTRTRSLAASHISHSRLVFKRKADCKRFLDGLNLSLARIQPKCCVPNMDVNTYTYLECKETVFSMFYYAQWNTKYYLK